MTTLLNRSDIRRVATWPVMIEAVRGALLAREAGALPAPVAAQVTMQDALLHLKAGALPAPPVLSVKANLRVTAKPAVGVVVLYDTAAGAVTGILDSADITAMRTAALATLAATALAPDGPMDLAVIGAGPVAAAVIAAMSLNFGLRGVRLWSRDPARAAALATSETAPISLAATPAEAARGATVIVTATPSRAPLLEADDLTPGALILALGADSPGKRELGGSILHKADLFADQAEDAMLVGECAFLPPRERKIVELGEVLSGPHARRLVAGRFTLFDSVGSAQIDAAVCHAILLSAVRQGLGMVFNFSA